MIKIKKIRVSVTDSHGGMTGGTQYVRKEVGIPAGHTRWLTIGRFKHGHTLLCIGANISWLHYEY